MEIYLKTASNDHLERQTQLNIKYFAVSQACGYSFDLFQTKHSKQEQKSMLSLNHSKIQEILMKMMKAYNQHKIDEANIHRLKYLKLIEQTESQINPLYEWLLKTIKEEIEDVWKYEKQLNAEGWVHKKNGKFYKIYTKHFQQTVAVLVDADIQVPIQNFIFVLNDFDLTKEYMPFMVKSEQVKQLSRNCKIGHVVNDFPILSKRQAFFQGIGYDRIQHDNSIFFYTRSIHNRKDLQNKLKYQVKPDQNAVQLQYKFFLIQYKPIDRKKGKIKIAMNVDLKIIAPKFILDPITQNFGRDFLKNVLNTTINFKGSEWERRSIEKPQFTNFIRQIINKYFPQ